MAGEKIAILRRHGTEGSGLANRLARAGRAHRLCGFRGDAARAQENGAANPQSNRGACQDRRRWIKLPPRRHSCEGRGTHTSILWAKRQFAETMKGRMEAGNGRDRYDVPLQRGGQASPTPHDRRVARARAATGGGRNCARAQQASRASRRHFKNSGRGVCLAGRDGPVRFATCWCAADDVPMRKKKVAMGSWPQIHGRARTEPGRKKGWRNAPHQVESITAAADRVKHPLQRCHSAGCDFTGLALK